MSLVKEIEDKGATLAWSPVSTAPHYVALGMKDSSGGGFDDYGGELEIHDLNFNEKSLKCSSVASVKTSGRFMSLAWSAMSNYAKDFPSGLIAGGMNDGAINIWDPAKLMAAHPKAQLSSLQAHQGAVNGIQFNPNPASQHLLASGGTDAAVYIHALDRPDTPKQPFVPAPEPNAAKHAAEVSRVAWNTQVPHILASASLNGSCIVWDLRQKKAWCELRDQNRSAIADVAWNPIEGLQIATGLGDDQNPVIKLWDLRSSTTLPLATLKGHSQGVLSMSWCPNDTSLLLSCGKDNRTFLWDLCDCRPVYELQAAPTATAPSGGFGGFGSAFGRRYEVSWSPKLPAVLSTCSFDRKVHVYSMSGTKSQATQAPKWLRRPVGASFGFGGKLVTFSSPPGKPGQRVPQVVKVSSVVEDSSIVQVSRAFEQRMGQKDFRGICNDKAAAAEAAGDEHEKQVWEFIKLIFEDDARAKLLDKLGFNAEEIKAAIEQGAGVPSAGAVAAAAASGETAQDFFGAEAAGSEGEIAAGLGDVTLNEKEEKSESPVVAAGAAGVSATAGGSDMVKKALLVGNFPAAVDACFQQGLLADALLLAGCGGAELWEQTRVRFFERETKARPYLNIVAAITTGKLDQLVAESDLEEWKQTLAIISTYAKSEEFTTLCEQLGCRLQDENGDLKNAALCYLCAINVPKTVSIWIKELRETCKQIAGTSSMALHALIEKVTVFTQEDMNSLVSQPDSEIAQLFTNYGALLANQGEMAVASKYITSQDQASNELRYRLFYAAQMERTGAPHPPAPFNSALIGISPNSGMTAAQAQAHADQQEQQKTQEQAQPTPAPQPAPQDSAGLPSGWLEQFDQASQRMFYVNTMTGQSQWEPPAPAATAPGPMSPVPATAPTMASPATQQPTPTQHQQPHMLSAQPATASPLHPPQPATVDPGAARVPKQDGFISGNVPTGSAGAGVTAAAPASATAARSSDAPAVDPMSVSTEVQPLVQTINATIGLLMNAVTAPPQKKALAEAQKAAGVLCSRLSAGQIDPAVATKASNLVSAMQSRNFDAAMAIHKDLTATEWTNHKDWIKGIKNLVQLAKMHGVA